MESNIIPQFIKDLAKENNWREELVDGVFNALWNYENVTRKIRDTIKNNSEFQNMVRLVIKGAYNA